MITKLKYWGQKFKRYILVGVLGAGVALAAGTQTQPTDNISQTAIKEKFAISALASKYVSEGSSFRQAVKPDWKEKTEVRIGNETSADFEPVWELRKWDETRIKLTPKLSTVAAKDKSVDFVGDKVEYKTPKEEIHFYDIADSTTTPEGGYEIEWTLNEKPATNTVEFTLETEGLDFFYQPPLNVEMASSTCTATDCGGSHRDENVVGSYAVYASEQKTNWEGGKLYRAGKVGHIFRPRIIDSAGTEVWGDLHIENGILSVTISQEFLDKAVYPVRHAAGLTFGYTTQGTSGTYQYMRSQSGTARTTPIAYKFTLGGAGSVSKITFYSSAANRTVTVNAGIYQGNAISGDNALQGGTATGSVDNAAGWKDLTYSVNVDLAAADWRILLKGDKTGIQSGDSYLVAYDAGSAGYSDNNAISGGSSQNALYSIITSTYDAAKEYLAVNSNLKFSIYATYQAASSNVAPPPMIIFE